MPLDDLLAAASAALGDVVVREILESSVGLATGAVRDYRVELAADRRPVVVASRVTKGARLPKR